MKAILIVCDGMPDKPDNKGDTPLSVAYHPGLDFLAANGIIGALNVGYEKDAETDEGLLKILGCYDESYPGRGYIEAISTGIEINKGDVCMRANFATLGKDDLLVDRRAGRDDTGLDELAEKLDCTEIDGIRFYVEHTLGHRLAIVMHRLDGKALSFNIIGNDPKTTNVSVKQITPKTPNAKITASALNKFLRRARKILGEDPVNKKRKIPANTIIVRSAGHMTITESFEERYGKKGCVIAAHDTLQGIAKFLGMDFIKPVGATGKQDTDLDNKTNAVIEAMKKYGFILLHVNAFDQLSHDRKRDEKTDFIEKFDRAVIQRLLDNVDLDKTVIAVTSDHFSISLDAKKGYEHSTEPVPFVVCGAGIKPSKSEKFDETSAAKAGVSKNIIKFLV
ncbi:MAG: hypothetical protein V1836_03705 [Candidatus Aenigmatarchaeota archaeon]